MPEKVELSLTCLVCYIDKKCFKTKCGCYFCTDCLSNFVKGRLEATALNEKRELKFSCMQVGCTTCPDYCFDDL